MSPSPSSPQQEQSQSSPTSPSYFPLEQQQQQPRNSALNNPFNQYNTEFVKLDIYNWNEVSNLIDPNAQFTLLSPDDDALTDCPMASDSINVLS